jgi:hypothetical protein
MTAAVFCVMWLFAAPAIGGQTPEDSINKEFLELKGSSWRVFAIDSYPAGQLAITDVQEIRQYNPPNTWGVFVRNRSASLVTSATLAAAIVAGDGTVKAVQTLPAIKNLKPQQDVRQELRIRVAVLMPTDRVVFFVDEVSGAADVWKASRSEVGASIKRAARRLPVP